MMLRVRAETGHSRRTRQRLEWKPLAPQEGTRTGSWDVKEERIAARIVVFVVYEVHATTRPLEHWSWALGALSYHT